MYGFAVGIRNTFFEIHILKSREFDVPVISVGNLSAGGTGKTPFTEYLISILKHDYKVAVLSRGYKRRTRGFHLVNTDSTPMEVGDEPLQIKRKFSDITVAVDRNRVHGIQTLLATKPQPNVVILDDAFQHRYVLPGLSILLMDYNHPYYHDSLLPFGRLREHFNEKKRAHIVVVTKCPVRIKPIEQRLISNELNLFAYQKLHFSHIVYGPLQPVFKHESTNLNRDDFRKSKFQVLLVTGIANSMPFKKHIQGLTTQIVELKFPDHHAYTLKDVRQILEQFERLEYDKKVIITTEKDAIRFQKFHNIAHLTQSVWYYIPIKTGFSAKEEKALRNQIDSYVRKDT